MHILIKLFDFLFPPDPLLIQLESMGAEKLSEFVRQERSERGIISVFKYKEPIVRRGIWELKYRGNEKIARLFANTLFETILAELEDIDPLGKTRPLLALVPMSKKRARERGLNHLSMLVDKLPKEAGNFFDIDKQILKKIKETVPQTALQKKKDRLQNPAGSFAVVEPKAVKDKIVFIVDDVITTGATLLETKKVLLEAGAKKVICFALAH